MSGVSWAALAAAVLFVSFHVPVPALSRGKPARLIGVAYHLLLLPAVATLPAPGWARAAGFAWMSVDVVLDGAAFAGLDERIGSSLRQGVHLLAAVWVVTAGVTVGPALGVMGCLLALAFLVRFARSGADHPSDSWIRHLNAVLNVAWFVAVAVALR